MAGPLGEVTWENVTLGTLASGIVLYFVRNLVANHNAGDKLRDDLMALNRQLNDQLKEANARADRFAAERSEAQRERNEAMIRAANAEKECGHLREIMDEMAQRCPGDPVCGANRG